MALKRKTVMTVSPIIAGIIIMSVFLLSGTNPISTSNITKSAAVDDIVSIAQPLSNNDLQNSGSGLSFVGGLAQITPQQAQAMEDSGAQVRHMTLVPVEKTIALDNALVGPGTATQVIAYTFNGTIPGPTFRVTEGDIINATIIDPITNTDNHDLYNHAAITSAAKFTPWLPETDMGNATSYLFVALHPGFYEYHCEGNINDIDEHVFRGMQGGVIVDPKHGYEPYDLSYATTDNQVQEMHVDSAAKEIVLDFSEYYLIANKTDSGDYDINAMLNHNDSYSYINGEPFGYQPLANFFHSVNPDSGSAIPAPQNAHPLNFTVGDHVRFFVLNVGDFMDNIHIVGEQLDRVTQAGLVETNAQTFNLGGSNTAIIDVTFTQPGVYVLINHDYSQAAKGQFAVIVVGNTPGPNPSNAVPPLSDVPDTSIPQSTVTQTFGTPLKPDCVVQVHGQWSISSSCPNEIPQPNGTLDQGYLGE